MRMRPSVQLIGLGRQTPFQASNHKPEVFSRLILATVKFSYRSNAFCTTSMSLLHNTKIIRHRRMQKSWLECLQEQRFSVWPDCTSCSSASEGRALTSKLKVGATTDNSLGPTVTTQKPIHLPITFYTKLKERYMN